MEFLGDLLFFTEGASLKVMDVRLQQVTTHSVHTEVITDLCLHGDTLYTVGTDGLLVLWPERTVVETQMRLSACRVVEGVCYVVSEGRVHSVALSTQEVSLDVLALKFAVKRLAVHSEQLLLLGEHSICVYKPKTLEVSTLSHEVRLNCVVGHPEYLVAGDAAGQILKFYTGGVKTKKHWHAHQVVSLAMSPDFSFVISGGEEGVGVLWQTSSSRKTFLPRLGATIKRIAVNHSAELYAFSLSDNSVKVFRAADSSLAASYLGVTNPASVLRGSSVWTGLVTRDNALVFTGSPGYLQTYDTVLRKVVSRFDVVKRNPVTRSHCEHPFPLEVTQVCFLNDRGFVTLEESRCPTLKLAHMKFWEDNSLTTLVLNPHNNAPRRVLQFRTYVVSLGEKFVMAWQKTGKLWQATHKMGFRHLEAIEACATARVLVVAFEHVLTVWDTDLKLVGEMCEPRDLLFKKVQSCGDLLVSAAGDWLHCWKDCQLLWMQNIGDVVDLVAEDSCYAVLCRLPTTQAIAKFYASKPVPAKVYPLDSLPAAFTLLNSQLWVLRDSSDIVNLDSEAPLVDDPFPSVSFNSAQPLPSKSVAEYGVQRGTQSLEWLSEYSSYELPGLSGVWEAFTKQELAHRSS
jgi:hypothetical protein